SLIKTVLALQHEEIPSNLHYRAPNPHIPWSTLPIRVVGEPTPWPRTSKPRRAGVSAFGISGTNAHAILEEAPRATPSPPRVAFIFSGASSRCAGAGRVLFETQSVFAEALGRCAEILDPVLGRPLLAILHPGEGDAAPLGPAVAAPVLFSLE